MTALAVFLPWVLMIDRHSGLTSVFEVSSLTVRFAAAMASSWLNFSELEDCNCLDVAGQKKAAATSKAVIMTIEQTTQIIIFMMLFFREVFMSILYWLRVEL